MKIVNLLKIAHPNVGWAVLDLAKKISCAIMQIQTGVTDRRLALKAKQENSRLV